MIIFSGTIFSQTLNFGLSQKQNVSDLPHSEFSFQKVQRKERSFIKGELDTGYLDTKLQHFNLDAIHNMDDEEAKMKHITAVIDAIKKNNLNVRH